jgi:hypothetical protein
MSKLLTFLRSFQNSPLFANLAIHAWLGYGIAFTLGVRFPSHRLLICVCGVLAAAFKEFFFDHRYELPPQPYPNAAQDFAGYMIGGALAILMWLVMRA